MDDLPMIWIQILGFLLTEPFFYPLRWLLGAWIIWLFLKLVSWRRPTLPVMMLYSVSVAIAFAKSFRGFCPDLCAPDHPLSLFLVNVAFWFVLLYGLMKLILRVEQNKSSEAPS